MNYKTLIKIGYILPVILLILFLSTYYLDVNQLLIDFGYGIFFIELNNLQISNEIRFIILLLFILSLIGSKYIERISIQNQIINNIRAFMCEVF